jgi:hypothetical protein
MRIGLAECANLYLQYTRKIVECVNHLFFLIKHLKKFAKIISNIVYMHACLKTGPVARMFQCFVNKRSNQKLVR